METRGNYFIVGVFTLALSFGIVLFIAWMMGVAQYAGSYKKLLIYFPSNVTGLSVGSQVSYRGVQVGSVTKIKLDPALPKYVLVMTSIDATTPLHVDTRALMGNMGITGLTYVELETDDYDSPKLRMVPGRDFYELQGTQSRLEQLLNEMPVLMQKFTEIEDRVISLLSNENIKSTTQSLANIERITHNLADQQGKFNQILSETQGAMSEFNYFLYDSRDTVNEIKDFTKMMKSDPSQLIFQPSYNGYKIRE
jgi:phospholipid/cholesterol/gamma-HCH transport system substrate-binding protein